MIQQPPKESATALIEALLFLEKEAQEIGWPNVSEALDHALSRAVENALKAAEAEERISTAVQQLVYSESIAQ